VPILAASSSVSGSGLPNDSGKKHDTTAPNNVPNPNIMKGSCAKVKSGRYKVRNGAAIEINLLVIELYNKKIESFLNYRLS
jgi:hypothetical protein